MGESRERLGEGAEAMAALRDWRSWSKALRDERKEERDVWAESMVCLRLVRSVSTLDSSMKSSRVRGGSSAGRKAEATMVERRVSMVCFRRLSASSRLLMTFWASD